MQFALRILRSTVESDACRVLAWRPVVAVVAFILIVSCVFVLYVCSRMARFRRSRPCWDRSSPNTGSSSQSERAREQSGASAAAIRFVAIFHVVLTRFCCLFLLPIDSRSCRRTAFEVPAFDNQIMLSVRSSLSRLRVAVASPIFWLPFVRDFYLW